MNTLKNLREEKKWTQEDLAKKMRVTRTAVVKWESSVAMPTTKRLTELADLLNCSVDYLLRDNM